MCCIEEVGSFNLIYNCIKNRLDSVIYFAIDLVWVKAISFLVLFSLREIKTQILCNSAGQGIAAYCDISCKSDYAFVSDYYICCGRGNADYYRWIWLVLPI